MSPASPVVGTNVPKKEAADKVTGRALYVDDLVRPGAKLVPLLAATGRARPP